MPAPCSVSYTHLDVYKRQDSDGSEEKMKLINIGFGNLVSAGRVVAVVSPDSAPVKRLVKELSYR